MDDLTKSTLSSAVHDSLMLCGASPADVGVICAAVILAVIAQAAPSEEEAHKGIEAMANDMHNNIPTFIENFKEDATEGAANANSLAASSKETIHARRSRDSDGR